MPIDLKKINVDKVNQADCELKEFCYLSDDNDFIVVTEWKNGDGFDIKISCTHGNKIFELTRGELDAINFLTKLV